MTDRHERVRQAIGRRVPRAEVSGKTLDLIVEDVLAALKDDLKPETTDCSRCHNTGLATYPIGKYGISTTSPCPECGRRVVQMNTS